MKPVMKKTITIILSLLAVFLAAAPSESETPGHACFSSCSSCVVRCRREPDRHACERTCREIKRSCCQTAGKGPGPLVACGCT